MGFLLLLVVFFFFYIIIIKKTSGGAQRAGRCLSAAFAHGQMKLFNMIVKQAAPRAAFSISFQHACIAWEQESLVPDQPHGAVPCPSCRPALTPNPASKAPPSCSSPSLPLQASLFHSCFSLEHTKMLQAVLSPPGLIADHHSVGIYSLFSQPYSLH